MGYSPQSQPCTCCICSHILCFQLIRPFEQAKVGAVGNAAYLGLKTAFAPGKRKKKRKIFYKFKYILHQQEDTVFQYESKKNNNLVTTQSYYSKYIVSEIYSVLVLIFPLCSRKKLTHVVTCLPCDCTKPGCHENHFLGLPFRHAPALIYMYMYQPEVHVLEFPQKFCQDTCICISLAHYRGFNKSQALAKLTGFGDDFPTTLTIQWKVLLMKEFR